MRGSQQLLKKKVRVFVTQGTYCIQIFNLILIISNLIEQHEYQGIYLNIKLDLFNAHNQKSIKYKLGAKQRFGLPLRSKVS